ncbi:MAG: sugar ABC transporter permease [Spirochaetales bacterium]|nr:sugar ABC transporter permease [Spirochaetales bacterium]
MNNSDRKALITYLGFVLPGLALYLLIVAYPIFYSFGISLTNFNPILPNRKFEIIGLFHYKTMLSDPKFWFALKNNLIVVAISVFGQIPIGFVLAYILYRKLVRGRFLFQAMVFLPNFLSTIVVGTLWKKLFGADGPVSRVLQFFSGDPGAQFRMMLDPKTVMIPIGFVLIWMYTGLYMIIFLANLQKINENIIEAAKIDGATEMQIFLKVIVPILSGTILVSTILAIAGSMRGFDLIFAITTQGITRDNALVLPVFMYQTAFLDYNSDMRFAYGATIANAIVFISVGLILLSRFISGKLDTGVEG